MSILPDHEIRELAQTGMISPFREEQLQCSSYDVQLGNVFRVAEPHLTFHIDLSEPSSFQNLTKRVEIEDHLVIHPGEVVLGQTEEYVRIPNGLVARIEGKSSVARLFLIIHMAGYVDPGFEGVVTLEMANFSPVPIVVRPGNSIAQLAFSRMTAPAERPYAGRYQGDTEATESRYGRDEPL